MYKILAFLIFLSMPFTAFCDEFDNKAIDQFLDTLPKAAVQLNKVQEKLKNSDDATADKLMKANMQGTGIRTAIEIAKDSDEVNELAAVVTNAGYSSIDEWALVGDRIGGVMFAARWVVITAMMPMPNAPEPDITPGANLFTYLDDDSKSPKYRKEYQEQLERLCSEYCYDVADIPVVGPRFDDILNTFESVESK